MNDVSLLAKFYPPLLCIHIRVHLLGHPRGDSGYCINHGPTLQRPSLLRCSNVPRALRPALFTGDSSKLF